MNRKAYVRVTERIHLGVPTPIEVIVGVQLGAIGSVSRQYERLRDHMKIALSPSVLRNYADDTIALTLEERLRDAYPNKSYFIEVGRGDRDEYVQVFEP